MLPLVIPDYGDIAQVSITLAGFTGLVGILQAREKDGVSELQALHIANLLMTTAFVTLLSFAPSWVASHPSMSQDLWVWSIRILLVVHLSAWIIISIFLKPGGFMLQNFPKLDRAYLVLFAPLGIATLIAEVFIVLGFGAQYSAFVYETVLLLLVASAMGNFLFLLLRQHR